VGFSMHWDRNYQVPSRVPRLGLKTVDPGPVAVSVTAVTMYPPFEHRGGRYWCRAARIDATATPFPEKYLVARAGLFRRQARPQYRGAPVNPPPSKAPPARPRPRPCFMYARVLNGSDGLLCRRIDRNARRVP
jgi:hypothetical protein